MPSTTRQDKSISAKRCSLTLTLPDASRVRIAYLDHRSSNPKVVQETIVLLHGFPQTSFQFRHVLPLLTKRGYRCIAPDYRGAGCSSKDPGADFRKSTMAEDIVTLLDTLLIAEPVHVVGHDIGAMIAFVLANRWPSRVRSLSWGECPLPGTRAYERDTTDPERTKQQFHFIFHCTPDGLAEALVAGRERTYITHFFNKLAYDLSVFTPDVVDEYARAYSQPGAMACAFGVYRVLDDDARENKAVIAAHGKCTVPSMIMSGRQSRHAEEAAEMAEEVTEGPFETVDLGAAGHYLAEETPKCFAEAVLSFIAKHPIAR